MFLEPVSVVLHYAYLLCSSTICHFYTLGIISLTEMGWFLVVVFIYFYIYIYIFFIFFFLLPGYDTLLVSA